jgi:hypothetical protein
MFLTFASDLDTTSFGVLFPKNGNLVLAVHLFQKNKRQHRMRAKPEVHRSSGLAEVQLVMYNVYFSV